MFSVISDQIGGKKEQTNGKHKGITQLGKELLSDSLNLKQSILSRESSGRCKCCLWYLYNIHTYKYTTKPSVGFYFWDVLQDKNGWMALFCHSRFIWSERCTNASTKALVLSEGTPEKSYFPN